MLGAFFSSGGTPVNKKTGCGVLAGFCAVLP
jgi:hypothetical protein